jgi:redox-sensitive bicupin YhaK (pirin superfamily)
MAKIRKIAHRIMGQMTSDGAGVRLRRIFGFNEEGMFDPFLLLDFFGSDNPHDYIAGFPWHPHRGMETVTYMLDGKVEHGDSIGNKGIIGKGDIQWMTAGNGIIHQEMPKPEEDARMFGLQLWINLPASKKMMPPRYQEIKGAEIPEIQLKNGVSIKVIAGSFDDVKGPVIDIIADPIYFDVALPSNTSYTIPVESNYTVFVFVFEGEGFFDEKESNPVKSGEVALLKDGTEMKVITHASHVRFLLISGKPIGEPIAWRGPIVMNTEAELDLAFKELREGNFIKTNKIK